MKQLCEIVKEFMMEGQLDIGKATIDPFAHGHRRIKHTTCLNTGNHLR